MDYYLVLLENMFKNAILSIEYSNTKNNAWDRKIWSLMILLIMAVSLVKLKGVEYDSNGDNF